MKKPSIGRPQKSDEKRKKEHYSVWLTSEQKQLIDQQIRQSNLSASQFFLTQVLETPMRRPKKKSLPKSVFEKITVLEKLSGLLSLSVLKTKGNEMIYGEWLRSSQNVKFLTHIITLWIFEDFDLPNLRKTLTKIQSETNLLYHYLDTVLPPNENKSKLIETVRSLYQRSTSTLNEFENYYQLQEVSQNFGNWLEDSQDIHTEIKRLTEDFLKTRR